MIEKKSAEDNFYLFGQTWGFEKNNIFNFDMILSRARTTDRHSVAPLFFMTPAYAAMSDFFLAEKLSTLLL